MSVPPGGYCWWYLDALSDDGAYGVTVIAFIGSVFSPYYAWSGRKRPINHCAINVALYGPREHYWTMTERKESKVHIERNALQIGTSAIAHEGDCLTVHIDEWTAPLPQKLRGIIRVQLPFLCKQSFDIDDAGSHRWRPISPCARAELTFASPAINWSGPAYVDSNIGTAPLEETFRYWDWSRTHLGAGGTAILYNTDLRGKKAQNLALHVNKHGDLTPFDPPPRQSLRPTPLWRVKRRTMSENLAQPKLIKTLEDTPFYARSQIAHTLFRTEYAAVHEAFSGDRLRAPLIKAMLPFRMPRL